MIASSATAGHPFKPRRDEISPSFICAPCVNRGSCACWAITPSNFLTYSSALRITSGSNTQLPSSLKTRTLARESAIAPISAKFSPFKPSVTAPIGKTSTNPALCPSANTCSTTPAVSATGDVFAIAETATKPPLAAAIEPERTVSASSLPGSRR